MPCCLARLFNHRDMAAIFYNHGLMIFYDFFKTGAASGFINYESRRFFRKNIINDNSDENRANN
jgi:hypothetical protein